MGRAPKLSKPALHVQERFCTAIKIGMTYRLASQLAGVGEATVYRWLQRGEADKRATVYREFWEAVQKAEAEGAAHALGIIAKAAQGVAPVIITVAGGEKAIATHGTPPNWTAAAWLLERRHGYTRPALLTAGDNRMPNASDGPDLTRAVTSPSVQRELPKLSIEQLQALAGHDLDNMPSESSPAVDDGPADDHDEVP